jgi:hypothetical protein
MIITRFHGRTGNQMFQYAIGRALALRLGVDLVLDDRLALHKGEQSLTRVFDLPVVQSSTMPPSRHDRPIAHSFWRHLIARGRYVRENGLAFDPSILGRPDGTYLHGYWQSEKYFLDAEETIRQDFSFGTPTGRNAELATQIAETPSVSLHLRRGDYVSNASHIVCAQPYYDAALAALLPKLDHDPQIFVFSDDPDWARKNLKLPGNPVVVDHNGAEYDYEDLRLMSLCKHNIIANSSFSWWGAWLNQNPGRHVIAPSTWFGKAKLSNPDIWARGWHKV